jgi:hypothetical protein
MIIVMSNSEKQANTRFRSFFSCRISFSAETFYLRSAESGPDCFFRAYKLRVIILNRLAT